MEPDVKNWLDIAEYDITTADAMYKSGRYLYVLFMCQQAVEKTLKGLYVHDSGQFPPRTHNLEALVELCKLEMDSSLVELVQSLTAYYIQTRYPEDIVKLGREISKETAFKYLADSKELLTWLKGRLK